LTHPIIMFLEKYAYSFMHYVIANQRKSFRKREVWHYKNYSWLWSTTYRNTGR